MRPRTWSGRHNRWVYASRVYYCPLCRKKWGGAETGFVAGGPYDKTSEPVGERVCYGHTHDEYKSLPKRVWPTSARWRC